MQFSTHLNIPVKYAEFVCPTESFQTNLKAMDMDERSKVLMAYNTKNMGLSNVMPCSLTDTQLCFKDLKSPVSVQNLLP